MSIRLTIAAMLVAVSFGASGAYALTVDESGNQNAPAAANLADPDESMPVPYVNDSGQAVNLQGGQGAGGFSFTAPSASGGSNAFKRAQDNLMDQ